MNVIERMKADHTELKVDLFRLKQQLPYECKKAYAEKKAYEFYNKAAGLGYDCHVSVGGLDSITLFLFLRSIGIRVKGVSASSLEDISIQRVHKALGIETVRPLMAKHKVIEKYGYPIISKETANKISLLQRPTEENATVRHAIITGETGEYGGNRQNTRMKLALYWLELFGGYENENENVDYLRPDFLVSDECCYYLKEKPCDNWAKEHISVPFLGLMASEGGRRQKSLMQNGCNYFGGSVIRSAPFAIFSRQDILKLALEMDGWYLAHREGFLREGISSGRLRPDHRMPDSIIPEIYGKIVCTAGTLRTTKAQRTGCSMCGFGIMKERKRPHRFDLLYEKSPEQWDFWLNTTGFGHVFDWIGFKWRQPYRHGEDAWLSKQTMAALIDARHGDQLSFFDQ
ncbi:MAG: hypothetical protein IKQ90_10280 [Ruminococcus sp.]|nr:hypothetical protein [Ruminococcus sp.]